jgi:hypothetical protein
MRSMAVCCSSLILCSPGMLLRYCLSGSEMVPVAPIITAITFAVTFHMCLIPIVMFIYFRVFSASILITSVSWNSNIYQYTCSSFITTDYDVRFIVGDDSVGLHLLIPPYLQDQFLLIFVHVHTSVHYLILPTFPSIYWSVVDHTRCHVSLCIVFLPIFATLTYDVLCCLIWMLTQSAFALCFCL